VPILALILAVLVAALAAIALIPVTLVQRYRVGTARRLARGWVASLNLGALLVSAGLFLAGAAVTNVWVPKAFEYALLGFASGCLLGLLGLALTRWEAATSSLYYTPNRLLVLIVTLVVTARVMYGFWRGWQAWQSGMAESWIAAAGVAGSLAAGAVVLGYYATFWAGVLRRFRRHRART
jgi:hypothetical protein